MGANEWRESDAWPPANRVSHLYLAGATDAARRLIASRTEMRDSSSSVRADPRQPVTDPHAVPGAHDYSALAQREDVLTFDSEPLAADRVVAGDVTAIIHASCDCADFDLWVRLQDVHPDGRAFNVTSPGNDAVRASYREPERGPQAVVPGEIYALRMPRAPVAIRFGKGHRVRVQVSASFDPHLSRNLQTGASEIDSAESRPAVITIHHDADYPSRLLLPLGSD
jgi:putative CocE/NonD family hydrolase